MVIDHKEKFISLIVRTTGQRSAELTRALKSVSANTYRPLEVILVYQGVQSTIFDSLKALASALPDLNIQVLQNKTTEDRRAENLNIGWTAASGRYVGFLDDDDSIEPMHFELLISALQRTQRVWAYSQTILRKEDETLNMVEESRPFMHQAFSYYSLWQNNFIPIHSFLVDRIGLASELREHPFNTRMDRSEDWDFLIRLGFFHEPAVVDAFTCVYYISTAQRNSNLSLMGTQKETSELQKNSMSWQDSKREISETKANLLGRFYWAREYFKSSEETSTSGSLGPDRKILFLFRRIIRRLIRILERLISTTN